MIRLLWKETREKRIWLLVLIASTVGPVIMGTAFWFVGSVESGWAVASLFAALLLGAGTYSSELAGAADFACSRPISWKKLLLAKLIVGIGLIIISVIIAAMTYRLLCPVPYVRFASLPYILPGIIRAITLMGLAYFLGFAASAVLPGAFGGVLVVLAGFLSMALELFIMPKSGWVTPWSLYARFLGGVLATVMLARFGLTLPTTERLSRYAVILAITVAFALPFNYLVRYEALLLDQSYKYISWSVSPDGEFAAVGDPYANHISMVRLSDGRKNSSQRYSGGRLYWFDEALVDVSVPSVRVLRMDKSGDVRVVNILVPDINNSSDFSSAPSPDGKSVIVKRADPDSKAMLVIIEVEHARVLKTFKSDHITDYWWQSDNQIGWVNDHGARHFLQIERLPK